MHESLSHNLLWQIYWASPGSSGRSMQRTEAQLTADTGHDGSGEENMNFDLEEYLKVTS